MFCDFFAAVTIISSSCASAVENPVKAAVTAAATVVIF